MLVDPKDLMDAKDFWKNEDEIGKLAGKYIRDLKKKKVYDFHNVNPEVYDMKAGQDIKGKKDVKREGKKKGDVEVDNEMLEQKQAGLEVSKPGAIRSPLENIQGEMGSGMPKFARGPEIEIGLIKDVEDLKHILAQENIHVDYKVLQAAIILPKDMDSKSAVYPGISDMLVKNPNAEVKKK